MHQNVSVWHSCRRDVRKAYSDAPTAVYYGNKPNTQDCPALIFMSIQRKRLRSQWLWQWLLWVVTEEGGGNPLVCVPRLRSSIPKQGQPDDFFSANNAALPGTTRLMKKKKKTEKKNAVGSLWVAQALLLLKHPDNMTKECEEWANRVAQAVIWLKRGNC